MKVVVTGLSMVTAVGRNIDECWSAITQARSGISAFDSVPTAGVTTEWGGQVRSVPEPEIGEDDRAIQLAVLALTDALDNAGILDDHTYAAERKGLCVGSCVGGARRGESFHRQWINDGLAAADDKLLWQYPLHSIGDALASKFRLLGARTVNSNACAAGAVAIADGMELLRSGHADLMVVGGSDPLAYLSFAGFSSLSALSADPCAPYTRSDGLSLGEGAAFLVLEEMGAAQKRGARILAELRGYGLSADAYHPTAPDPRGRGARKAMVSAASMAGVEIDEIGYINGHGTGTPANDAGELRLTKSLGIPRIPVSSTKSMIGHTLGAAGAVEAAVSVKALDKHLLPPTHVPPDDVAQELKAQRSDVDGIDIVPDHARDDGFTLVASNSFAFGGNNATLLFSAPGLDAPEPVDQDLSLQLTSYGALAGNASNADEIASKLFSGDVLYDQVVEFDADHVFPLGRVPDTRLSRGINPRSLRRLDRLSRLAAQAVSELLRRTPLPSDELASAGLVFATGYGPLNAIEEFQRGLLVTGEGDSRVFPNTVMNAAAGHVALLNGVRGPTATFCAGGTSAVSAMHFAGRLISSGACDKVILVSADEATEVLLSAFYSMDGYLSKDRLKPRGGSGRLFCEASVALLLERPDTHPDRSCLAEIMGFGMAGDGSQPGHIRRDSHAIRRAMEGALGDAGLRPSSLDLVVGMACGSTRLDTLEEEGLSALGLSQDARVSLPKSCFGDALSTSSLLALLQVVWVRKRGYVPALFSGADARVDASAPITALVNSFEIGGSFQSMVARA